MGLIMLILVGTVPTVYALNKAIPDSKQGQFIAIAQQTEQTLHEYQTPLKLDAQSVLASYLNSSSMTDEVLPAMLIMNRDIANQISAYGHLRDLPQAAVSNVRNEMYLLSESINKVLQEPHLKLSLEQRMQLSQLRKEMDSATKFIPVWVKVSVAISLALGTMIGWRRIVITIGEKIGKSHLTYAQGASAELITMTTIAASDMFGLPVSTTHVLSSGVAGTMVANRSGIHMQTIRNLIAAWVLTMPMAILMSASFYYIFIKSF
jgi:PiT family inorganic phosphate transporter